MSTKQVDPAVEKKLTDLADGINTKIDSAIEKANKAYEEAEKNGKSTNELTDELKGEIKELVTKYDSTVKELDKVKGEFEKARSFRPSSTDAINKAFEENKDSIASLVDKRRDKSAQVTMKAQDFFAKDAMTTGSALGTRRVIPFDRVIDSPVYDPEERPLRDFFRTGTTSADSVEWPIEQVPDSSPQENWNYDNQAGAVDSDSAEEKPQSEFQWDLETRPVRDIAHYVTLHKNLMNDLPLLQSYLPSRLRDGLMREESRQIIQGQDASQEIVGLNQAGSHAEFDVSGFQAAVVNNGKDVAEANFIDILGWAKTQLRSNNYAGTLALINPEDFYSFMFSVNDEGTYHMNNPVWLYVASIVEQNNYIPQGKFFVMDRNRSNLLLFRENVNVEFSYEHADNFTKNLVTIRAEERAVQVTERPNGVIYGDFADAVGS